MKKSYICFFFPLYCLPLLWHIEGVPRFQGPGIETASAVSALSSFCFKDSINIDTPGLR